MTAAPAGPRYPTTVPGDARWGRAARAAWSVQWRCQVLLAGIGFALLAAVVTTWGDADGGSGVLGFVWLVHAGVTLVVGYPVGVVAGRLLPEEPSRAAAAGGFALAGGVAGALVILAMGASNGTGSGVLPALWALLGAVVAASARAWAHRAIAQRAARRRPVTTWPPAVDLPGTA